MDFISLLLWKGWCPAVSAVKHLSSELKCELKSHFYLDELPLIDCWFIICRFLSCKSWRILRFWTSIVKQEIALILGYQIYPGYSVKFVIQKSKKGFQFVVSMELSIHTLTSLRLKCHILQTRNSFFFYKMFCS